METRYVVTFYRLFTVLNRRLVSQIAISLLLTSTFISGPSADLFGITSAHADTNKKNRQTVRFYKVNNLLQADRLRFTNSAAKKPGCHNFIKKTRVHRLVQLGYESCSVYAKKSCRADSIISAVTEKDKTPVTELTQGFSWFFDQDEKRGERMKSWHCK